MAIIKDGSGTGALLNVENATKAALVAGMPLTTGISGAYMARWTTGVLGAALAVDASVASIRNGPTTNTKNVYVQEIRLTFSTMIAFTAQQQFGFYLEKFSASNLAGGTTYTPMKLINSTASACLAGGAEGGDIRVSTTAALTVVGVTFTGDKVPVIGWCQPTTNAQMDFGFFDYSSFLSQPIKLAAGEGLALRNLVVWPAAGTGIVTGYIKWLERTT